MDILARKVVEKQIKKGAVRIDEKELYQYGYTILFEKVIAFLMTIIVALVLDAWIEIVVFCIAFVSVRMYAGGFHANSVWGCMILSLGVLVSSVLLNELLVHWCFYKICLLLELVLLPIIFRNAPMEHKKRPISASERRYFNRMVHACCLLQCVGEIILCVFGHYELVGIVVYAHCVIVISLLVQKRLK